MVVPETKAHALDSERAIDGALGPERSTRTTSVDV
jgi:hypothetical protein